MLKRKREANIIANIYEGDFQISFDCVGVEVCRFALCDIMPPTGEDKCGFWQHCSCINPHAQCAAIEKLLGRLKAELKERSETNVR